MEEPEDDYWEITVKSADGTLNSRKFSKKGTYQASENEEQHQNN